MAVSFGIVVFPGSNCDHDAYHSIKHIFNQEARFIWHKDDALGGVDVVLLPGGFSYGDYLRSGAIARFSPVMKAVTDFANGGGLVIGICNGFQVLCESHLLPGGLGRNRDLRFICKPTYLRTENNVTPFTNQLAKGQVLDIPIAHGDGSYYADDETLTRLEAENRVIFRYVTSKGEVTESANPNGSRNNIAGIINERGNVLGMMPHPERHVEPLLGSADGAWIFRSLIQSFVGV